MPVFGSNVVLPVMPFGKGSAAVPAGAETTVGNWVRSTAGTPPGINGLSSGAAKQAGTAKHRIRTDSVPYFLSCE